MITAMAVVGLLPVDRACRGLPSAPPAIWLSATSLTMGPPDAGRGDLRPAMPHTVIRRTPRRLHGTQYGQRSDTMAGCHDLLAGRQVPADFSGVAERRGRPARSRGC